MTIIVMNSNKNTSCEDIIKIFPQIKFKASVFGPCIKPMPKNAIPSTIEKIIPIEIFGSKSPRSAIGPMSEVDARQKNIAISSGFICNNNPNMAPAKAACDIATPTNGIRIITTHTPTMPHAAPPRTEAISAR